MGKAAAFADTKKFDVNVLAEYRLAPDYVSLYEADSVLL